MFINNEGWATIVASPLLQTLGQMFDIYIESNSRVEELAKFYPGKLILQHDTEFLACSAKYWKSTDYRKQWLQAAKHLLKRSNVTSAFVTAASAERNPKSIEWWVAVKIGKKVFFHEQLLCRTYKRRWLKYPYANKAHGHVPKRMFFRNNSVSQWEVSVGAIQRFIVRRNFA